MIKEFFEGIADKAIYSTTKYDDLTEEDTAKLFTAYLGKMDSEKEELKKSLNELSTKTEANSAEVLEQVKSLTAEMNKKNAEISELNLKMAQNIMAQPSVKGSQNNNIVAFKEAVTVAVKNDERRKLSISKEDFVEATKATVLTTSVADSTLANRSDRVGEVGHRVLSAYDSVTNRITIGQNEGGIHRYFDVNPAELVRGAAQIAEGVNAPESTIEWIENSLDLKETADFIPYSKRFEYDFNFLMNEIDKVLRQNVALQIDDQIINGDGTGQEHDGFIVSMPAWVPVASGITDANLFDVVAKMRETITSPKGSKYRPNVLYINPLDVTNINAMLKKDQNNNYIPIMQLIAQLGIRVVENSAVVANTAFFGDSDYITLLEDNVMDVETGYIGDQFRQGLKSLRISTRKNTLIRAAENDGFLRVTSLTGAYTTLAT